MYGASYRRAIRRAAAPPGAVYPRHATQRHAAQGRRGLGLGYIHAAPPSTRRVCGEHAACSSETRRRCSSPVQRSPRGPFDIIARASRRPHLSRDHLHDAGSTHQPQPPAACLSVCLYIRLTASFIVHHTLTAPRSCPHSALVSVCLFASISPELHGQSPLNAYGRGSVQLAGGTAVWACVVHFRFCG